MASQDRMARLAEKVRFLSSAQAYPGVCGVVEAIETHMSWVFLTEDLAYKLKKPVKHTFLDFSTIAKRKYYCEEELRLNRRLAAETYLRVVPLCYHPSAGFQLGGQARVIDWLVEMKRLPQQDMLDNRIRAGNLARGEIIALADLLADFYLRCEPASDAMAFSEQLVREQGINRDILLRARLGLKDIAAGPLDDVDRMLHCLEQLLTARALAGAVIDGHGDLRPEHVCLSKPPQIFDCLEFNREMRRVDPFDEVNYLGMECALLGAEGLRHVLVERLQTRLKQRVSADLLALYGAYRALLRARLCMAHLLEKPVRQIEKWRPLAISYIEQARRECLSSPFLREWKSIHSSAAAARLLQ